MSFKHGVLGWGANKGVAAKHKSHVVWFYGQISGGYVCLALVLSH